MRIRLSFFFTFVRSFFIRYSQSVSEYEFGFWIFLWNDAPPPEGGRAKIDKVDYRRTVSTTRRTMPPITIPTPTDVPATMAVIRKTRSASSWRTASCLTSRVIPQQTSAAADKIQVPVKARSSHLRDPINHRLNPATIPIIAPRFRITTESIRLSLSLLSNYLLVGSTLEVSFSLHAKPINGS